MTHEHAENDTGPLEGFEPERPMPRGKLDTPEMRSKIAKAKERAKATEAAGSGMTADDLLQLARERRSVDARTER